MVPGRIGRLSTSTILPTSPRSNRDIVIREQSLKNGLARISHTFSSRSGGRAGMTRRMTEAPASVLYGTLRRPTECNTVRPDHCADVVEGV